MKFAVRYWSSLLPDYRLPNGEPRWVDYSIHPATKLGLHNALLTLQDRREILEHHGGIFDCAVYVQESDKEEMLGQEAAERLFVLLPHGEVKWLDIRNFLPAPQISEEVPARKEEEAVAVVPEQQLSLFEHPHHTPYDKITEEHHDFDTNA